MDTGLDIDAAVRNSDRAISQAMGALHAFKSEQNDLARVIQDLAKVRPLIEDLARIASKPNT